MDIAGTTVCGCSKLRSTGCPKSFHHYIDKMPHYVKRLTVSKIKKTREGVSCGSLWKPSAESCICNMRLKDFKGPTRSNNTVVPLVLQPKAIYLPNLVSSDKVFFLRIIYLLDVHNKIQVGMEFLPLGNSRTSRWRQSD